MLGCTWGCWTRCGGLTNIEGGSLGNDGVQRLLKVRALAMHRCPEAQEKNTAARRKDEEAKGAHMMRSILVPSAATKGASKVLSATTSLMLAVGVQRVGFAGDGSPQQRVITEMNRIGSMDLPRDALQQANLLLAHIGHGEHFHISSAQRQEEQRGTIQSVTSNETTD